MKRIETIFLDIGNVLAKGIEPPVYKKVCDGIDYKTLMKSRDKYFIQLCLGKLTERQYWEEMKRELNIKHTVDELVKIPYEHIELIEENIAFAKELSQTRKVGIISNHTNEWSDAIIEKGGFKGYFDPIIISSRVAARKPDLKIYHIAMRQANARSKSTLFVDDKEKNVKAARTLGINGLVLKEPRLFRSEVERYISEFESS